MSPTSVAPTVESSFSIPNSTGSSPEITLLPQQLIAMSFSHLGRLAVGGILAWNMAAMPTLGTSPLVLDRRNVSKIIPTELPRVSYRPTTEQLQIISQVLNLSKSELARVMRITRPPLYDWIKGKSAPKDENARRLNAIAVLVDGVVTPDDRPLFSLFITEPIEQGASSILDYLQQEVLDQAKLTSLLAKARDLTAQRDSRLVSFEQESPKRTISVEAQEAILDQNLTLQEWDKA